MAYEILLPQQGSPRDIRGVLFDMDGVILDTEKLYARFWAEACAAFGFSMTYPQALGMRSLNPALGEAYLVRLFGSEVDFLAIKKKRIELMDAYVAVNGVELKAGVLPLLDYLNRERIPCAVTTSSPLERARNYLGRFGLAERFDHICTAHRVAHGKPEPDIYLFGAQTLGLPPENCLALEDSYTGILAACRAGCKAVIVPDLDAPGEEILSIAWGRADTLLDIRDLLETENSARLF